MYCQSNALGTTAQSVVQTRWNALCSKKHTHKAKHALAMIRI